MKRCEMEAHMKSRSRGGVPKSVGRPIGILPVETSRKPMLPSSSSTTGSRKVSLSRASSTTSYRSLASGCSTRDKTERTVSDLDSTDGQDTRLIDGPGNSATASARSLRQQNLARRHSLEAKTVTPAKILELCQEEDFYKVFEVDLHGMEITAIPDLEKFRKVRILDLSGNQVKKIQHLEFTQDLRDLKLYDNKIAKLEGLEKLKELCCLQVQYNEIGSLGKSLTGLKKLKWLRLDSNKLTTLDTSELLSCVQLTTLDLSNNRIANLSALSYLPNLEELYVSGNSLQKLTNLNRCKKLMEIDLSRNRLSDLSAISGLPNLQILDLSCNHLKSVTSLGKMKSLEHLNLGGNKISELSGWGAIFPKLEMLNICDNIVTTWKEVWCLKELPELVEVYLAGNPVMLEGGECLSYHSSIGSALPSLEIVDGAHVKRSGAKGGAAPLMRPMSASSVLSVRQVDMQLKNAIQEQESMQKSITDRFASLRAMFDSLPAELPPSPPTSGSATPQSSRCSSRNRIREAQAFAAAFPK